jgi:uncharacterized protein
MATLQTEWTPIVESNDHGANDRIACYDWPGVEADLDRDGVSVLPALLTPAACGELAALYDGGSEAAFRSRVVMARHGFGRGEYKYFDYPLPERVAQLRTALYQRLAPTANRWNVALGLAPHFPPSHAGYLARCRAAGQARATPLLLRYGAGDFNCLHQDLYGDDVFPLQVVVLLSRPGAEFDGGELVLTEQRPRMQSRPQVVQLRQGDAAVFAVHHRPLQGTRGVYRVTMRHGVSRIHRGTRSTLGLIFHDAA